MAVMYKNFGIINKVEQRNYYGFPIRSASGSIAQFSDGAPEVPIKNARCNLDYSAGWFSCINVFNRTGKNLINYKALTWFVGVKNSDGSASYSSGSHYSSMIRVLPNTTYTISGTLSVQSTEYRIYYLTSGGTWIDRTGSMTSSPYTFTTPNNCGNIQIQVRLNNYLEDVQLEIGSDATTYEQFAGTWKYLPFQFGTNIFDGEMELGTYNTTTGAPSSSSQNLRVRKRIYIKPSTDYCFVRPVDTGAINVFWYDSTDALISYMSVASSEAYKVLTSPANAEYLRFYMGTGYGTTYNNDIGVNVPATTTTFVPFIYIYGGYYDSETGVLTSTKAADGTDLATPVEYQLQPVEIIQAQGQNNIWNDTGDTLAEYRGFSNVSGVLDCLALSYTNNNEMIYNNQYAGDSPAYAVSVKDESYWLTPDPTNSYIGYKFSAPVVVNAYEMRARNNGNNYDISQSPRYWIIQGSNDDGVTWENVFESGHEFTASGERFAEAFGNTTKAFKWWRMFITTAKQTDEGTALAYLMFKTISFEE